MNIEKRFSELEARIEKLEKGVVTIQKDATTKEVKIVSELIKVCSSHGLTYEQAKNIASHLQRALDVMAIKNQIGSHIWRIEVR